MKVDGIGCPVSGKRALTRAAHRGGDPGGFPATAKQKILCRGKVLKTLL